MSGPKDYTFMFDAIRLMAIRQQNAERGRRRARIVAEDLASAREQTEATLAQMRQSFADANQTKGAALRDQAASKRQQAHVAAKANSSRSENVDAPVQSVPANEAPSANAPAIPEISAESIKVAEDSFQQLAAWQKTLAADTDTQTFRSAAYAQWAKDADALTAHAKSDGLVSVAGQLSGMAKTARQLHDQAGELSSKFHTRNLLLRDVIDSMKSIGFFVADPFFEVPDDPSAPVILKATKGSETVSASIDLSDTIRSVWDGVEHEACKDTFFKYIDEMKSRGVAIEPTRPDLHDRPILKQRGANELPRSNPQQRGN